jgi:tRNA threonylcarbamoyladenosine biosynthesis protein TsaE
VRVVGGARRSLAWARKTPGVRVETGGPEETEAAGAELAGRLARGDVVLVEGELGTGKTTFVRGACQALGVREPVTSPTFTIGQLYRGEALGGPLEVAHLDLYRLPSLAGEEPGLLDDYLTPERVAFVEWPGAAEPAVGEVAVRVRIEHRGGDRRMVEIA